MPHIETKRTTVNSTWFDYNTGCADTEVNIEHEEPDIEDISTMFSSLLIKLPNGAVDMLRQLLTLLLNAKQLGPLFKAVFGHPSFQLKQEEAIYSSLKNNNTFVVMPMGGGKSII